MNTLYMLIGLPGSGKSHFRNQFLQDNPDVFVYSTDDYLLEIASSKNISYNDALSKHYKTALKRANQDLIKAIEEGRDVLWDQMNIHRSSRIRKTNRFPEAYKKIAIVISCDIDEIVERCAKRENQVISEKVIRDLHSQYTYPTDDPIKWDEIKQIWTTGLWDRGTEQTEND